jgi:hypothetical protein
VFRVIYSFALKYNQKLLDPSDYIDPTDDVLNASLGAIIPHDNYTQLILPAPLMVDTVIGVRHWARKLWVSVFCVFFCNHLLSLPPPDTMVDDFNHNNCHPTASRGNMLVHLRYDRSKVTKESTISLSFRTITARIFQ